MTLTLKQLRIIKNVTAIILFIVGIKQIFTGLDMIFNGDLYTATLSIVKIGTALFNIFFSTFLRYGLSFSR